MLLYGYPGLMSADSADQLDDARRWILGDWHPPLMSLLWRFVELFVAGPFGMFAIQVSGFVIGAYAILRTATPDRAALATLAIGFFPPVLWVFGVVWKDAQMAAFALLGIASLFSERKHIRGLGIVAFVIASAMRHNAAALTFAPLVLLWGRAQGKAGWRRALVGLGVWAGITVGAAGINAAVTRTPQHPWATSLGLTDVIGIMRWAPPISDDELRPHLAGMSILATSDYQRVLTEKYTERGWNYLVTHDSPLGIPTTDAERDAVARTFRHLVTTYPGAYLYYRARLFRQLIRLGEAPEVPHLTTTFTYTKDPELQQRLRHDASKSGIQRLWFRFVRLPLWNVFYLPFIYLFVALALIPFARRTPMALALLLSGIGYELPLFFIAPADDLRYSHWLVLTTLLAAVIVVATRWKARATSAALRASS